MSTSPLIQPQMVGWGSCEDTIDPIPKIKYYLGITNPTWRMGSQDLEVSPTPIYKK